MRTQMSNTSLAAYRSFDPATLQAKEQEVYNLFLDGAKHDNPLELTRETLAMILGWKESAVCGRVNSLVKKGFLEESAGGITYSGRSAMLVHLPVFEQ